MRWSTACLLASCTLVFSPAARAYCLGSTCGEADCSSDCQGAPLYWNSDCIPFSVHRDGSAKHDIDAEALSVALQRAFATWASVDCGAGEQPSFQAVDRGEAECSRLEYNAAGRNANVVLFRDEDWPYQGGADTLGRTTLTFDTETGEIYDADIELNGTLDELELDVVLLHEVGHFLGLAHSEDASAVMYRDYVATQGVHELADDDVEAICEGFAPGRVVEATSCEPRHGFAAECLADQEPAAAPPSENRKEPSCSVAPASRSVRWSAGALALGIGAARGVRRRRRTRRQRYADAK
jgi:hypothetical protein